MLVTMSNGSGKIMVEFFSAEMEFNVCNNKQIETEYKFASLSFLRITTKDTEGAGFPFELMCGHYSRGKSFNFLFYNKIPCGTYRQTHRIKTA